MQTKNEKLFEGTSDKAKQIEQLSSLFGYMPELRRGTRTHSIITVDFEGNCKLLEFTLQTPVDELNLQWCDLRSNENYEIVNIVIEQNIIYNREKIDTEIFHNENKYYMNIFLQLLFIIDCYLL